MRLKDVMAIHTSSVHHPYLLICPELATISFSSTTLTFPIFPKTVAPITSLQPIFAPLHIRFTKCRIEIPKGLDFVQLFHRLNLGSHLELFTQAHLLSFKYLDHSLTYSQQWRHLYTPETYTSLHRQHLPTPSWSTFFEN